MTSTIKADVIEAATGTNTDLTLQGKGTGVPDIETGFKVSGTVGLPLSDLRVGTAGNLITYDAAGDPAAVATGTAAQVLTSNGAGAAPTFQDVAGGDSHALYTDQVPSGSGKTALTAGAWRTVPLTTEVYDPDAIGSLASNQITLSAGTYRVNATHEGKGSAAGDLKIRFRNITDSTTVAVGFNADSVSAVTFIGSWLQGRFTIASAKVFELQAYPLSGAMEYAIMSTGEVELWAFVKIVKE
jgi:hypothetical protein